MSRYGGGNSRQVSFAAGTAARPGLSPLGDIDSGIYWIAANNLGVSVAGAKVLDISATGLAVTGALSCTGNTTLGDASGDSVTINASTANVPNSLNFTGAAAKTVDFNSTHASGSYTTYSRSGVVTGDIGNGAQICSTTLDSFGINARIGALVFGQGNTERARIDTSGNLLIGRAALTPYNTIGGIVSFGRGDIVRDAGNSLQFYEQTTASLVGSVTITTTTTTYNTSSDYRLPWKEGAVPLTGSGEFIDALRPLRFPLAGQSGFIAHEFALVSPSSVTGEKDAVDAEGKPVMQAMQASSPDVIANIVAELQSVRSRERQLIAALETYHPDIRERLAA